MSVNKIYLFNEPYLPDLLAGINNQFNFISNILEQSDVKNFEDTFMAWAKTNYKAQELINKAFSTHGKITVELFHDLGRMAQWDISCRTIKVKINGFIRRVEVVPTDMSEAFSSVIFELCNAINPGFTQPIKLDNFKTSEEFVLHIERIEYATYSLHQEIVSFGIDKCGWNKCIFQRKLDFEEYWKMCNEPRITQHAGGSHANTYRMKFNEITSSEVGSNLTQIENLQSAKKMFLDKIDTYFSNYYDYRKNLIALLTVNNKSEEVKKIPPIEVDTKFAKESKQSLIIQHKKEISFLNGILSYYESDLDDLVQLMVYTLTKLEKWYTLNEKQFPDNIKKSYLEYFQSIKEHVEQFNKFLGIVKQSNENLDYQKRMLCNEQFSKLAFFAESHHKKFLQSFKTCNGILIEKIKIALEKWSDEEQIKITSATQKPVIFSIQKDANVVVESTEFLEPSITLPLQKSESTLLTRINTQ